MRGFYLARSILGFLLLYLLFVPFVLEHGLDIGLFVSQMFENRIAAFLIVYVLVTSVVLWGFVFSEGRRLDMQHL